MKVTKIHVDLLHAFCHLRNASEHLLNAEETNLESYKWKERLESSLNLVNEYLSCFTADGNVSQRGIIPQVWNPTTIFETDEEMKTQFDRANNCQLELDFSPPKEEEENA